MAEEKFIKVPVQKGPIRVPDTEKSKLYREKQAEEQKRTDMIREFQRQVYK